MTQLAFRRCGSGEPLILLHGLGLNRHTWDPLVPALAEQFDVVAVDLPGFGDSDPMPAGIEPSPATLAATVAALLDDLGIDGPHVVGNSLGGWVALELGQVRPLASLTLLSPAGLWAKHTPFYSRVSLRLSRWLARHATRPLSWLVKSRVGRIVVLGQSHGRPWRLTPDQARATVRSLGTSVGFDATLRATLDRRYLAGPSAPETPVTLAFGSRDLVLLPWQSRHLDQLPSGTRLVSLPGCGHVPVLDDSEAVTALIIEASTRTAVS